MPDHPILDPAIQALVRRKVRAMTLCTSSRRQNRDDLSQHLFLKLLEALPRYDHERAPFIAFAERVLQRAIQHFIRDQSARKRRAFVIPLPADGIADPHKTESCVHADLRSDVAHRISTLPDRLRVLAERLKAETPADIARDLGLASSTLRGRLAKLRQPFEDLNLKKFL